MILIIFVFKMLPHPVDCRSRVGPRGCVPKRTLPLQQSATACVSCHNLPVYKAELITVLIACK